MEQTKEFSRKMTAANNGFLHLFLNLVMFVAFTLLIVWVATWDCMTTNIIDESGMPQTEETAWIVLPIVGGIVLLFVWFMHLVGLTIIHPQTCRVLTLFGKYSGTVKENGFFWMNPFYSKRKLSLRARNMDMEPIKVNDKTGNPIMIGLVLVWKVKDTYKASFEIDVENKPAQQGDNSQALKGYDQFVHVQGDAALRQVAGLYAYDIIESDSDEVTLRSGSEEINERLEKEIASRLSIAGIEVIEARINYLAYAAEIASVMLRRQQADAIISAREKIVEGAVSMVDLALKKLSEGNIVELDEEKKAAMVSNLMVVLCSDEGATPVVNAGTLYQG